MSLRKLGQGIWLNLGNLSTKGTLRVKNKSKILLEMMYLYI